MSWTDITHTASSTTLRNLSRFIDITPVPDAQDGVDFAPTITGQSPRSPGIGFFIDNDNPVVIHAPGDDKQ